MAVNGAMIMKLFVLAGTGILAGCATTQFAAVQTGAVYLENLEVTTGDDQWNRAPSTITGFLQAGSQMWTRDGPLLDRVMLLPGIGNGQALFKSTSDTLVYPLFNSNMQPNEIVELTEASLTKLYGTDTLVKSTNLRPHRLKGQRGVMFDLIINGAELPTTSGRAAAFVHDGELYELIYLAPKIYYFNKHWDEAFALMESVRIVGADEN